MHAGAIKMNPFSISWPLAFLLSYIRKETWPAPSRELHVSSCVPLKNGWEGSAASEIYRTYRKEHPQTNMYNKQTITKGGTTWRKRELKRTVVKSKRTSCKWKRPTVYIFEDIVDSFSLKEIALETLDV